MKLLGSCVFADEEKFTGGVSRILMNLILQRPLNNFSGNELRYLHLVTTSMLKYCVNFYLWRETVTNTGNRIDLVLGRKVPVSFWKMVYDALNIIKVPDEVFVNEQASTAFCLHLSRTPKILHAVCKFIWKQFGLQGSYPKIYDDLITDGNFLFNFGSIIPSRFLLTILFCLVYWDEADEEVVLRRALKHIFIAFLIIEGYIYIDKKIFLSHQYSGIVDLVCDDIIGVSGVGGPCMVIHENRVTSNYYSFINLFNNNFEEPSK